MSIFKSVTFLGTVLLAVHSICIAHPAAKINLNYNIQKQILYIDLVHKVKDIDKHYIEAIKVFINDEFYIMQNFKKQYSTQNHKALYYIPEIKKEDNIIVEIKCNQAEKQTKLLIVKNLPYKENNKRTKDNNPFNKIGSSLKK